MIRTSRPTFMPGFSFSIWTHKRILLFVVLMVVFAYHHYAMGEPSDLFLPVSMKTDILGDYLDQSEPIADANGESDDLALAVAISGGSFRAANFAAGVLVGLEQLNYNLLQEVDYISSVSGGGWAVAIYIRTLLDYIEKEEKGETTGRKYQLADYFASSIPEYVSYAWIDYPKTLLRSGFKDEAVAGNLISLMCKAGLMSNDIASVDYFEKIYDNEMLGYNHRKKNNGKAESLTFKDIFPHKTAGRKSNRKYDRLPYWVMNATIVETGELLPITPNVLKQYKVTGCIHRGKPYAVNETKDNLPVSVGLAGSAAFPFIISPLKLQCDYEGYNELHLIDGGMADNLGGYSAITLLMQDKRPHKVLLLVDAFNSFNIPFRQVVHAANKRKIIELCEAFGIHVVCLDFDVLEGEDIYKELLAARTVYFDVSRSTQDVILEAAKMIVDYKLGEIKAGLPLKLAEKIENRMPTPTETVSRNNKKYQGAVVFFKNWGIEHAN